MCKKNFCMSFMFLYKRDSACKETMQCEEATKKDVAIRIEVPELRDQLKRFETEFARRDFTHSKEYGLVFDHLAHVLSDFSHNREAMKYWCKIDPGPLQTSLTPLVPLDPFLPRCHLFYVCF